MKRPRFEQNYGHILQKDSLPGIQILVMDRDVEHSCRHCGAIFMGKRNAVWCDACAPAARARSAAKSQRNQQAKRAARRAFHAGKAS